MGRLRFMTAGESHGAAVLAVVEGVPAGLPLLASHIDAELARRHANLDGVIVGKALYEKRVNLPDLLSLAR